MMLRPVRRLVAVGALATVVAALISAAAAVNTVPVSRADDQTFAVELEFGVPPECSHISFANVIYDAGPGTGQNDLIFGTDGNDNINGGGGDDCILGLAGDDILNGSGGNDVLLGGPGDDTLIGQGGSDRLYGEDGDDVLDGGGGNDLCSGGPGTDTPSSCETMVGIP